MIEEPLCGIRLRPDATEKAFWYSPEHPGHIVYNDRRSGELRLICVGHDD